MSGRQVLYHDASDCYVIGDPGEDYGPEDLVPVAAHLVPAGTRLPSGFGVSTVLPDMDFETYSEAGYWYDEPARKWRLTPDAPKGTRSGLHAVGATAYAMHPSTEVLSLAYNLKTGAGEQIWLPGCPPPTDLFDHLARGGLVEAWNSDFEYLIWTHVCRRMGWPEINPFQLRDAMAKARAHALPGALGKCADVLHTPIRKDNAGKALLNRFSKPHSPTKKEPALRIRPEDDPEKGPQLFAYNIDDIRAESAASALIPDLTPSELEWAQWTQLCNYRGVGLDREGVEACIAILEQAYRRYNLELSTLTGGHVPEASKVTALREWCAGRGVPLAAADESAISAALARPDIPPDVARALQIRQLVGSAGVKKVYAMRRQATPQNRLCGLFIFNGARTGRDTGADVQPQNLVKAGPRLYWCDETNGCGRPYGQHRETCPHCGAPNWAAKASGWGWEAVDEAIHAMKTGSLDHVEDVFGSAVLLVSGCIRGLFHAAPGHDFICSDFSSIEAVVTAVLAGEEWRIDAFRRKQDIYYVSAARITRTPLEAYLAYKAEQGEHHPDRQKVGKPAELGLGFGGWLAAWRQFDSTDTFTDEEVKANILAWREASPAIVEMWGGQVRGKPWRPESYELFGLEGAAIAAVQNPGQAYQYRYIAYQVKDDVLYCRLPSGRMLRYHRPRLTPSTRWEGQLELSFEGYNSNPKMGPIGWIRIQTYGGRLMENVVQAVANDILRYSAGVCERAGYPTVLRVHDELVAEVPEGWGSVEEFEQLMGTMPDWAADWPIRAAGGWRGKRYRKD